MCPLRGLKTIVNESQFPLDKYLHISVIKLVVGYDGIHPSVIFTDRVFVGVFTGSTGLGRIFVLPNHRRLSHCPSAVQ